MLTQLVDLLICDKFWIGGPEGAESRSQHVVFGIERCSHGSSPGCNPSTTSTLASAHQNITSSSLASDPIAGKAQALGSLEQPLNRAGVAMPGGHPVAELPSRSQGRPP